MIRRPETEADFELCARIKSTVEPGQPITAEEIREDVAARLLIHGEADNNSGTFPLQSERFYNALKGHGANARFVLLPHEAHAYRARESLLHLLWETTTWLDTHVKNARPAPAK